MENELFEFIAQYMPLTEAEKQVITDLAIVRSYPKGAVLLREGERSNNCYFVLRGCLRCYYVVDGDEKTTAFYTEQENLIPVCAITKAPSEQYVACLEDSLLIVTNSDAEQRIFGQFPRFETLCRLLTEDRLMKQQVSFDQFKYSSPEGRYVHLLTTRPDLLQRVPQHQIASYLGVAPQSLSRIRRRVQQKARGLAHRPNPEQHNVVTRAGHSI